MAYAEDSSPPRVYLQNVDSGRRELLGNFPGMSFAPRFSPDGNKVVMSMSAERPQRHLRDGRARPRAAPAHQHAGDRHLAVLFATTARRSSSTPTAAARSSSTS